MIKAGLVSVTFRKLMPLSIVKLVAQAGLVGIEWGGDIHVPTGNIPLAREVAHMTTDTGLRVAAYGSYYHVGTPDAGDFCRVVETAVALSAPTIRVWAGARSSGDADAGYRTCIADESRRLAELASQAGMTISFEFHGHTLTDTSQSALHLLREVNHPAMRCYWQPPVDGDLTANGDGLRAISPYLSNVHVFHWQFGTVRHLLSSGEPAWLEYIDILRTVPADRYALLEFVKDDRPENFLKDAATLLRWLGSGNA